MRRAPQLIPFPHCPGAPARTNHLRWLALPALLLLAAAAARAQGAPEPVGQLTGADVAVKGPANTLEDGGRNTIVVFSGSDITVRSGQARIALAGGGEMGVCGPTHLTLLKSGATFTVALEYGCLHVRLNSPLSLTFYTPLIVATPMAIGGYARETTVGLDAAGTMCILAQLGAVRIEQQLTGQSLLVPQSAEITLTGGQIESIHGATGMCRCEVEVSAAKNVAPATRSRELSVPAHAAARSALRPPQAPLKADAGTPPQPPAVEEPIYQVFMPPLSFDASAPAPPPDPSPETMLLVREVRVQPVIVFTGTIESGPPLSARPAKPGGKRSAAANRSPETARPRKKSGGFLAALRRLFGGNRCAGVGCA